MSEDVSEHFQQFAKALEVTRNAAIAKYGPTAIEDAESGKLQKQHVEKLSRLEEEFRLALIQDRRGAEVYEAFVDYIRHERRQILDARPFFRERQKAFTRSIAPALRAKAWRRLFRFHINYRFVAFALQAAKWPKNSKVVKLAKDIADVRTDLVTINLPLVITRARIFWSKTPRSHMSFMDLISTATEGMMSGIDKYTGPYRKNYFGVLIGRMTGDVIDAYSQTHLHFYPSDMRKLYRANKYRSRRTPEDVDVSEMVEFVNAKSPHRQKTNVEEITELVAASSVVSADSTLQANSELRGGDSETLSLVSTFVAPEDTRPDVRVEQNEALAAMHAAARKLSLMDRKLLRLRGVDVPLEVM